MARKCKQIKEFCFDLNDAAGPITWVRVTCARDARNKRECYTINLYSGSSDDDPPTPAFLSGAARLQLAIPDHQLLESGLDALTFARHRIRETVERKASGKFNISFILNPLTPLTYLLAIRCADIDSFLQAPAPYSALEGFLSLLEI